MMRTLTTPLTKLLNIKHPLVLAPMGGVSGARLASAVSNAGGLGLIGASYGEANWMRTELAAMRDVAAPWGVGLVMFTVSEKMELLHLALDHGPDVVALSFGDTTPFIRPIRDSGAKILVQVHDVDQAVAALDAGADALIVQGAEAGGHSLRRSSFPLFPAVRDAVGEEPVLIATGGIADGRGVAAALALGMDGAMMGTRFYACDEALPSLQVKQRVVDAVASETVRTRIFDDIRGISWPSRYSGRAIANDFTARWIGNEAEMLAAGDTVQQDYMKAVETDDISVRAIWAGEIVDVVRDVRSANEIVESTVTEAVKILRRMPQIING
ncbi:NAD(P)H-dependent flavin oxidoreductase [Agrobacterium tumefaciens]|uniref:NAD(P)H-dependent flavin oxidoreductase n=1 Tax=Agrobacterium tumefaciens TaxID=358 RepID=UPI0021D2EE30|nr:nitronate monooxygenase [Agrobacterium tumefaciens]